MVIALAVIRSGRKWPWLLFGCYCGLGVGLRSTLMLLGLLSLMSLAFLALKVSLLSAQPDAYKAGDWASRAVLVACGMVVTLLPWSLRNHAAYGSFSPLPHNGGIVLQQIYNAQNPRAEIWVPPFVNYLHPSEIWRGYAAEAERRVGHSLSPPEIDRYWSHEGQTFMEQHPGQVLGDMLRKSLGWLSATELANNRSAVEERMFSPVLAWLPAPAAWLLGMGLAGLLWLALEERRWPIVAAPIFLAWLTMAVFFAESRFRFHAASMLALCSGVWIEQVARHLRDIRKQRMLGLSRWRRQSARCRWFWAGEPHPRLSVGTGSPGATSRWASCRRLRPSPNGLPKSSLTMHPFWRCWATRMPRVNNTPRPNRRCNGRSSFGRAHT